MRRWSAAVVRPRNQVNRKAATPWHKACQAGHASVARILVATGAHLSARTHQGQTPTDLARANDHHPLARMLDELQLERAKRAQPSAV